MFSPVKLQIKPSRRVAILISIPFVATSILILSAQIPLFLTLIFVSLNVSIGYHAINKFAFLTSPLSIKHLQIDNDTIFLQDNSGQRYIAKPFEKNIIHPLFCLLSFNCEQANGEFHSQEDIQIGSTTDQESTIEIITVGLDEQSTWNTLTAKIEKLCDDIKLIFLSKNRRLLLICQYNNNDSSAFRRARVHLKYNQ